MPQAVAVAAPALISVANAVAVVPTRTERLLGNTAATSVAATPGGVGVKRKARLRPSWRPTPAIWPPSLMAAALVSTQPDPAGSWLLRSLITPFCQTNARDADPLPARDQPTTCPAALMPLAWLDASPGSVPRSRIAPPCQRRARDSDGEATDSPATWPEALIARALLAA